MIRITLLLMTLGALGALAGCPVQSLSDNDTARQAPRLVVPRPIRPAVDAEDVQQDFLLLTWTAVPGATQYEVYLGLDLNPPLIAVTRSTSLLVNDLPGCAKHQWRVVAVRDDGTRVSSATWRFTTRCR